MLPDDPFLFFDGHAGKVPDMLLAPGQLIEQRGLAAILVAREGDGDFHASILLMRMMHASSPRIVSAYPLRESSIGSPKGATFRTNTRVPGVSPMSKSRLLKAPLPVTESMMPDSPGTNWSKLIC